MVEILRDEGNFVALKLSGTLHDADYQQFIAVIRGAAEKGKVYLLAQLEDFHGWDAGALWDDFKFDEAYGRQMAKIALIGDTRWEAWMAKICKPFTSAEVQYFSADDAQDAWAWVQDGL